MAILFVLKLIKFFLLSKIDIFLILNINSDFYHKNLLLNKHFFHLQRNHANLLNSHVSLRIRINFLFINFLFKLID